jgi:adenine phosphoribosyltransferase
MTLSDQMKSRIREVPDFPIPGINFKDITPLFLDANLLKQIVSELVAPWKGKGITRVLGIESRGFLLGPAIAMELCAGFVIVRKKGKLPPETQGISYSLEYGNASIEMVKGSVGPEDVVLVHDDLLATGGTSAAAAKLSQQLGGKVVGFSFITALAFLNGKNALKDFNVDIHYLLEY